MPDSVAATDSAQATATPQQGTEAPTNDLAQTTDDGKGQQPAPQGFDEDFLKRLDTLDPANLPQSFAEKFVPKAEFTRKTQALAEDRKKFDTERAAQFELMRRVIADRPASPTGPTAEDIKRKELLDLASNGDGQAMQDVIRMEAERLIQPVRTQQALQTAYQAAANASPYVAKNWNEIYQTITTNPRIGNLIAANGMEGAAEVMIALGQERELMEVRPAYAAAVEKVKALEAKVQGYERERAAGLPSSTTRAGTTAGRPATGDTAPIDEVEAGRRAWLEVGGSPDTYR